MRDSALKGLEKRYDTVIFFLVDAFGWSFFERYRDTLPFFKHFEADGRITRIDSQFPSTTACHVTTIHTGLPVGQSSVFDWQYYEPKLDTIIAPLLFSKAGIRRRDNLKATGIKPEEIIPSWTLYRELASLGVDSHIFQHKAFTPSSFSNVVFDGASVHAYTTLSQALVDMEDIAVNGSKPNYLFFYFAVIDDICHHYGPDSRHFHAEVETFFTTLEQRIFNGMAGSLKNTLFMVTADHGQVAVDPATTIFLNLDPAFTGFQQFIRTNRKEELIIPGGSCRNMILYIRDGAVDEAREFLSKRLEGRAAVYAVQDMIKNGLFGNSPVVPEFVERAGDLMILPFGNESVWWYERGRFEQRFYGHHGGLSKGEVRIPLLLHPF